MVLSLSSCGVGMDLEDDAVTTERIVRELYASSIDFLTNNLTANLRNGIYPQEEFID